MAADLISVGSAGTMIAAVLETGGYIFQSFILDELTPVLKGSVGGFIYLLGVVACLFAFAIRGSFKLTPWLLIGPALFFSVILPRTKVENARWQFAKQERRESYVKEGVKRFVEAYNNGNSGKMEVSTLFSKFNKMISLTIQEIVAVLNKRTKNSDKMFIFRSQMFSRLYSTNVEDPGFKDLIKAALFGHCAKIVNDAQVIKNDLSGPAQKQIAENHFNNFYDKKDVVLTQIAAHYVAEKRLGGNPTTKQIEDEVTKIIGVHDEEKEKFSCKEIWELVYDGILDYSEREINRIKNFAKINDVDINELLQELNKAALGDSSSNSGATLVDNLSKVTAKYILRNITYEGNTTNYVNRMGESSKEVSTVELPSDDQLSMVESARISIQEYSEKTRMLHAASNLPYYQGLGLFFLGTFFPFFALLLLMPGKQTGFLHWFVIWIWVKSWDIGFAVVMLLDNVLYGIFAVQKDVFQFGADDPLNQDFTTAMYSLSKLDPTFQMGTYYNIIAVALLSIPVISSQLILGSVTGGASLVSSGMNQLGTLFARTSQHVAQQVVATTAKQELYDRQMSRAFEYNSLRAGRNVLTDNQRKSFASMPIDQRNEILSKGSSFNDKIKEATAKNERAMLPSQEGYVPSNIQIGMNSGRPSYTKLGMQRFSDMRKQARLMGAAGELVNPKGFSTKEARNKLTSPWQRRTADIIKSAGKLVGTPIMAIEEVINAESNVEQGEYSVEKELAFYDVLHGEEGKKLEFKFAMYGGLAVSWIQSEWGADDAYSQISDYEKSIFFNKFNFFKRILKVAGDEMGQITDVNEKRNLLKANIRSIASSHAMFAGMYGVSASQFDSIVNAITARIETFDGTAEDFEQMLEAALQDAHTKLEPGVVNRLFNKKNEEKKEQNNK